MTASAPAATAGGVRGLLARRPLAAFVVLAYLISWSWWLPLLILTGRVVQGVGWPTHLPGLAGPLLSAAIVSGVVDGGTGLGRLWSSFTAWRIGWWWSAVPITLAAGAVGVAFSGGDLVGAELWGYSGVSSGLGALLTVLIVFVLNGLGEEAGWRGFAVPRLLGTRSLTATSLIVAAMWAPWHLPLFFVMETFGAFGIAEIIGWVLGLTAGSFLLTWLYRGSGGSVLLVAVWHTAFNFTSATPAASGTVAAITSTIVMIVAVGIAVADRRSTSG